MTEARQWHGRCISAAGKPEVTLRLLAAHHLPRQLELYPGGPPVMRWTFGDGSSLLLCPGGWALGVHHDLLERADRVVNHSHRPGDLVPGALDVRALGWDGRPPGMLAEHAGVDWERGRVTEEDAIGDPVASFAGISDASESGASRPTQ